jgi:hypothetical protein
MFLQKKGTINPIAFNHISDDTEGGNKHVPLKQRDYQPNYMTSHSR